MKVKYGNREIEYSVQVKEGLKSHYITVERGNGVVLKGSKVDDATADKLILKKAKWILDKMDLVRSVPEGDIVTGSRIPYLGRRYYVEVIVKPEMSGVEIEFTHSKFRIFLNRDSQVQKEIEHALYEFYREKAEEKVTPRVLRWSKQTGLEFNQLHFRKMNKRWGSCTSANNIIINLEAMKLPFTLIDYLIVHELCHTKIKNHTKEYWAEVSKHIPNWKVLDAKMAGMGM